MSSNKTDQNVTGMEFDNYHKSIVIPFYVENISLVSNA